MLTLVLIFFLAGPLFFIYIGYQIHKRVHVKITKETALSSQELIFKKEMDTLRSADLITDQEYNRVIQAHSTLSLNRSPAYSAKDTTSDEIQIPVESGTKEQLPTAAKSVKKERVLSQQEIRDRNITWILIIGVIFVITAGIIFATSNWSIFSSTVKTLLVALVTVMFFGISIFTEKTLKISKTAFAFWILGALFVPVTVLSVGYFELLGKWLSLSGEGRYVLGVIGATASTAIYAVSTYKYSNRLFAWLTLIAGSVNAAFIIASFKTDLDKFYLGIVIYNCLLVLFYSLKKLSEKLKIFVREMQTFIPVNLVISTFFMLVFFEDPRMYGFNLILISLIYIFMAFSKWEKEYSFGFSFILVYGIYQIVENTPLVAVEFMLYALVGFIFAGMEYSTKKKESLRQIFLYSSGFVSLFTFIYVNIKGMVLFNNEPSWSALVSFILIALNYFYLSYRTKNQVFAWLAPVFLLAAGGQGYLLIKLTFNSYLQSVHLFLLSVFLFVGLYYFNKWKYTKAASQSSGIIALLAMFGSYLLAVNEGSSKTAVIALLVFAGCLYLVSCKIPEKHLVLLIKWAIPVVLALDIFMIFDVVHLYAAQAGAAWYSRPVHFGFTCILLYLTSIALRTYDRILAGNSFWVSHIMIPLALILLSFTYFDFPPLFIIPLLIYLYSLKITIADKGDNPQLCSFLYAAYTSGALTVFSALAAEEVSEDLFYYIMPFCSTVLALIWFRAKDLWRKWTAWYFIPFSLLGGFILSIKWEFASFDFGLFLLYIAIILYVLHKSGFRDFTGLALLLLYPGTISLYHQVLRNNRTELLIVLVILFAVLRSAGQLIYQKLYDYQRREGYPGSVSLDWYSIGSLFLTVGIYSDVQGMQNPGWIRLIPPLILSFLLFSQRNRVGEGKMIRIADTIWIISLLLSYETFIDIMELPLIISSEARLLPLIPMAYYITRKVWKGFSKVKVNDKFELLILLFICAVLFKDILIYDYFADALITGVLSLISLLAGMQYQKKPYFLVGSGALILNGIIQTREFWQSLPWWAYLLIAGLILIGIASYNEMRKRKQ